jgi:tuberous sclerosis protein 2
VVTPLGHGTNQVTVKAKEVLAKHLGTTETKVISDHSLPILVRQLALHANVSEDQIDAIIYCAQIIK